MVALLFIGDVGVWGLMYPCVTRRGTYAVVHDDSQVRLKHNTP